MSYSKNDSLCCQGHRCSFFLAIIASYAASAMRATPIINFLATPTGTVAMIICSLAIIDSYASFWNIMQVIDLESQTANKLLRIVSQEKKKKKLFRIILISN